MIFFYVFSYDLDLLLSKRNHLIADTVRKIFCLLGLKLEMIVPKRK